MSCIDVDPTTQTILDFLAGARSSASETEAIVRGVGLEAPVVLEVLAGLVGVGWVFGGPDRWQLAGVGYAHASTQRRSGLLGDGR